MGAARSGSAMAVAAVMWAGMAAAAVYEVGDKVGWTIMGNPNYGAWAASKKFHPGDTVVTECDRAIELTELLVELGSCP